MRILIYREIRESYNTAHENEPKKNRFEPLYIKRRVYKRPGAGDKKNTMKKGWGRAVRSKSGEKDRSQLKDKKGG